MSGDFLDMQNLSCASSFSVAAEDAFLYLAEDDKEGWHDEKQSQSADKHAADGSNTKRMVAVGTDSR